MRAAQWIVAAGVGFMAMWFGCSSDPASTNTGGAGGKGGGEMTGSTGTTGTGSSGTGGTGGCMEPDLTACAGVFGGDCGTCVEANCCAEVAECNDGGTCTQDWLGCIECAGGDDASCFPENQPYVDALIQCAQTNCNAECFPPPPPPPPPVYPACGPDVSTAATTKSDGACGMGVGSCNPVTNAPCTAGQACDVGQNGFQCYDPPNNNTLCSACGSMAGWCQGGMTCMGTGANADDPKCVRFCCSDADCGAGAKCDLGTDYAPLGLCVEGGGGAGGAGGAGGGMGSSSSGMGGAGGAGMGGAGGGMGGSMMMDAGVVDGG